METIERVRQEREILDVISEQQKWFKYWRIIPAAVTMFFAVIYFALGIVYAVSESLGFLFLFWCGGAVFCALCYFILKIRLSYQVLHIYYLKKISLDMKKKVVTVPEFDKDEIIRMLYPPVEKGDEKE